MMAKKAAPKPKKAGIAIAIAIGKPKTDKKPMMSEKDMKKMMKKCK
jgi:tmRNA-binding protein